MITATLYTINHRYFLNGKEVFGSEQKMMAAIFGEVRTREVVVTVADGKTKNKAYEAAYQMAEQGGFKGVVTKTAYS